MAKSKRTFELRLLTGESYRFESDANIRRIAKKWSYLVRNRLRWDKRTQLNESARRDLASFRRASGRRKLAAADIDRIGAARVIEVRVPDVADFESSWELRVLPWEHFLSSVAAAYGNELEAVTRNLWRAKVRPYTATPRKVMVVESAPGDLESKYTFESERELVQSNLQVEDDENFRVLVTPTLRELRDAVADFKPHVVHLAGIDAHEGALALRLPFDRRRHDGYYLEDEDDGAVVVDAKSIAEALTPEGHRPLMVCCGFFHSASRICPWLVREGVEAAFGIRDEIDDGTAELFYATLYRAFGATEHKFLPTFRMALQNARSSGEGLRGAGLVLWSRRPLLDVVPEKGPDPIQDAREKLHSQRKEVETATVGAHATPCGDVNYARLHNGRPLFQSFSLHRTSLAHVHDVRIEVVLRVGPPPGFRYRASVDVKAATKDMRKDIRIPLTWEYMRDLRESVRTTIYAHVTHEGRTVLEKTWPVTLHPANEWLDTPEDNVFLPSFVLPSDPAVAQIIDAAQKYLEAYGGSGSGFDGYQSVTTTDDGEELDGVDHQVQAIWHTLYHDFDLKYVNPPPTYTEDAQRLRTPSRIIEERRGTCIDLALLFAACLEYIEIHPVLFLMKGHAFGGYWRSESAYERYFQPTAGGETEREEQRSGVLPAEPWVTIPESYDDLMRHVWEESLAPIETVYLTERETLLAAWDAGIENLQAPEEFDVALQIRRARERSDAGPGVTPIPYEGWHR